MTNLRPNPSSFSRVSPSSSTGSTGTRAKSPKLSPPLARRIVPVKLPLSGFATQSTSGLNIDGFDSRLPDAVVVRTIPGGTFEAVTLRLGILHALRELGISVWNDARAIERCVDKSMTSFLLVRAGIPTPATWAMESTDAARTIVRRELAQGPLVLKPLFGSQGRGLKLIRT